MSIGIGWPFALLEGRSCGTLGLRTNDTIEALSIVLDNINRMDKDSTVQVWTCLGVNMKVPHRIRSTLYASINYRVVVL